MKAHFIRNNSVSWHALIGGVIVVSFLLGAASWCSAAGARGGGGHAASHHPAAHKVPKHRLVKPGPKRKFARVNLPKQHRLARQRKQGQDKYDKHGLDKHAWHHRHRWHRSPAGYWEPGDWGTGDWDTTTEAVVETAEQSAPRTTKQSVIPHLLQSTTQTFKPATHPNYAHIDGMSFDVGIGHDPKGVGIGAAGYEIEHVRNLHLEAKTSGHIVRVDGNSFVGFMIDYHTDTGYSRRVALGVGMYSKDRFSRAPRWGTNTLPDQYVDFAKSQGDIDLNEWAPAAWDGRVWFTIFNQNGGTNTSVKGRIAITEP